MAYRAGSRRVAAIVAGVVIVAQLTIVAWPAEASGTRYHVSTGGDDSADGTTLETAFRTISRCAAVAGPGDTCTVHGGTYRETVVPANSGTAEEPIRFEAAAGEQVTVDGADPVTDWSAVGPSDVPAGLSASGFGAAVAAGHVYEATVALNERRGRADRQAMLGGEAAEVLRGSSTPPFANQLFVDGSMATEARWPNSNANPLTPTLARAGPLTTPDVIHRPCTPRCGLDDPHMTEPPGFWEGGTAWIVGGPMVMAHTAKVLHSVPGSIVIDSPWARRTGYGCIWTCARPGNTYYLTGKLGGLDAPGEWFYDAEASRLYLWPPSGGEPSDHVIEAKQRDYAFDLSGRSHIVVEGFNVFAATIVTDGASTHNVIDGINAFYVSHFVEIPFPPRDNIVWEVGPFGQISDLSPYQETTGILLNGSKNVLRNSSITFSAGNGVSLRGEGNTVENNVISEVVYGATTNSGIAITGPSRYSSEGAKNHRVTRNTVFNVGGTYGAIGVNNLANHRQTRFENLEISYNDIFNTAVFTMDGGPLYICCSGQERFWPGVNAHHNWSHDHLAKTDRANTLSHTGSGLYADQSTAGVIFHHNVSWNHGGEAMRLNGAGSQHSARYHQVYNNTLGPGNETSLGTGAPDMNGTRIINNIFRSPDVQIKPGAEASNNLPSTLDPLFVDPENADFRLQDGSPAIDYGIDLPGFTDGSLGAAPDAGAYEFGGTNWRPGCDLAACQVVAVDDQTSGASGLDYTGNWKACQGCDGGGRHTWSYRDTLMASSTAGDTATLAFSGSGVQLHARTGPAQGILAVSIDGGPETLVDTWAPQPGPGTNPRAARPEATGDQVVWRSPMLAPGEHTLQVRVTGTAHDLATGTSVAVDRVNVMNMAPPTHWSPASPTVATPSLNSDAPAEGTPVAASATFTPGEGTAPFRCTVDYGEGSGPQAGSVSNDRCTGPDHVYGDDGEYAVTVSVKASDTQPSAATASFAVANVAPAVESPVVEPEPSQRGDPVAATAAFNDPGAADGPFLCEVDFGDGSSVEPWSSAGGECASPSHVYDEKGSYVVTISVTDKDGDTGRSSSTHTVEPRRTPAVPPPWE